MRLALANVILEPVPAKKPPSRPRAKLAQVRREGEEDKKIGEDCWFAGGSENKSVVSSELYVQCFSVWIFVWILRLQFVSLLRVIGALYLCIFVQFWRKQMFCQKKAVLQLFLFIDFLVPFIYKEKDFPMENMIVTFFFCFVIFKRLSQAARKPKKGSERHHQRFNNQWHTGPAKHIILTTNDINIFTRQAQPAWHQPALQAISRTLSWSGKVHDWKEMASLHFFSNGGW